MSGIPPSALARHAFVAGLPADYVALLAAAATDVSFPAGYRLFEEGGPAQRCWLIRDGHVALDMRVPGPARLLVETLGAGDVIGLSWLVPPREWQFGAEVIEPTTAFELDGPTVIAHCESDPALGYELIKRLMTVATVRLHATRIRLLDLYGRTPAGTARPHRQLREG
ncbi:MAG TPA: cyclic nucleotide-binding domain-containing protein [Streptosporangiaceae bacterium]|nr:cyclic nucleotide-binding domain-containing protein [Streptosporangiaceae bacterium]